MELLNTFDKFSSISELKPNKLKCKISGIGILKGVKVALCGLKCLKLENKIVKIFQFHYLYNKKIQQEKNFRSHITKIENVLKIWKIRQFTLEGGITIFKSLATSKIKHLVLTNSTSAEIIDFLNKIQKKISL